MYLEFEWAETKAEANIQKHGIDFDTASDVFDDPNCLIEDSSRPEYGEIRMKAIGSVQGRLITVIFTDRGQVRRTISARRVRDNERRKYYQS